ncbi:hypothetical protein [Microcoleus anatoxicus]|uniref:Secreted protein n=1 Tax=Microcoleus anatoxicus PTRS2 TaxID=2705321 RepID=A0ABU8YVI3_9CYAN
MRSHFFTQAIALRTTIAVFGIWCEGRSLFIDYLMRFDAITLAVQYTTYLQHQHSNNRTSNGRRFQFQQRQVAELGLDNS